MTSRFVSGGVIDAATGETSQDTPAASTTSTTTTTSKKQAEWAAVTAQLESERRQRENLARQQAQAGGQPEKSLYEVLQANKAAKQAAFEEAHRLRNQFRALDDDEVEFLEEVRARQKREEEEGRREVERGLEKFKAAQRGVGNEEEGGEDGEEGLEGWGFGGDVGRKRRRKEGGGGRKRLRGVGGLKRASTGGGGEGEEEKKGEEKEEREDGHRRGEEEGGPAEKVEGKGAVSQAELSKPAASAPAAPASAPATSTAKSGGLLVDYGSSEDDD